MNSLVESQQQDLNINTNNNSRKASARCKIDLDDYVNPLYLVLLSPILKSLKSEETLSDNEHISKFHKLKYNNNTEKILLNERILASILYYYKKFMEDFYGKDSPKPRDLIKLPNVIFKDFSVYGPLHLLLVEILNLIILPKGINQYEKSFTEKSTLLIESLKQIENLLIKENFIKRPVMFFNKVPFKLINKLFKIVTDHGGEIVNSEELATHIIEYNEEIDNIPEEAREDFIRITEKKTDMNDNERELILVHWWYHPDSYDEWIPDTDIDSSDPPDIVFPSIKKDQWRVCCRFITDCELYNEWCNEIDYENEALYADEEDQLNNDSSGLRKRGRKKVSLVTSTLKEFPIPEAINITSKMMVEICPPSIKHEQINNNKNSDNSDSNGHEFNIVDIEPLVASSEGNDEKDKMSIDENNNEQNEDNSLINSSNSKKRKIESFECDDNNDTSPNNNNISSSNSQPDWFVDNNISQNEYVHIGEIISSNQTNYIDIRNNIIKLYKNNPNAYLTGTECRRNVSGDANLIIKIHEFLNSFGLINNSIEGDARPSNEIKILLSFTDNNNNVTLNSKYADKKSTNNNNTLWTKELDQLLLEGVKNHYEDWEKISSSIGVVNITASDCLMRFIEISIDVNNNIISHQHYSAFDQFNSFKNSFKTILDDKLGQHDSYKIIQKSFEAIDSNDKKKLVFEMNTIIDSYLDARLEAFDHKIRLLDSVEKLLEIDRVSIEVDRKDMQIKIAQLSSLQHNK